MRSEVSQEWLSKILLRRPLGIPSTFDKNFAPVAFIRTVSDFMILIIDRKAVCPETIFSTTYQGLTYELTGYSFRHLPTRFFIFGDFDALPRLKRRGAPFFPRQAQLLSLQVEIC